jgi:ubiquinone biosynthesis monooxygenase Coq7
MNKRSYSIIDQFLIQVEHGLMTLCAHTTPSRPNPAENVPEPLLTPAEQRQSAALMRVNHAGEVCAQALYYGQLVTTRSPQVRAILEAAAEEENDHLAWTKQRILELQSHPSYLNIFWYQYSFLLGMVAGLAGDQFGLGFVEETERQVSEHLDRHMQRMPSVDIKSYKIIEAMRVDEQRHGYSALQAGAKTLPKWIRKTMACLSKIMTTTAAVV